MNRTVSNNGCVSRLRASLLLISARSTGSRTSVKAPRLVLLRRASHHLRQSDRVEKARADPARKLSPMQVRTGTPPTMHRCGRMRAIRQRVQEQIGQSKTRQMVGRREPGAKISLSPTRRLFSASRRRLRSAAGSGSEGAKARCHPLDRGCASRHGRLRGVIL